MHVPVPVFLSSLHVNYLFTQVFHGVPPSLGFNIEVKYPLPERAKDGTVGENYDCFDCNDMADTILKVVDHHAGDRMVIFSCFNPDMCTV